MALEKMKYQLRDWFAGTENYIGKTINMPEGTGLTPYWLDSNFNGLTTEDGQGSNPVVPDSKIVGLYNVSNTEKFVIARWTDIHGAQKSAMFLLDDIFANGGVSSNPLTHLYQGFRHLLNRKVALVDD